MRATLLRALLCLVVVLLCWGGAIAYWRATDRMPGTTGVIVVLVLLPLAVLALWFLGRRLLALGAAASLVPAVSVAAAPAPAPERAPVPALALIGAALHLPHGADAAELGAALLANKAQPQLDPELRDDDGYPVMSARAALADDADEGGPLREQVATWLDLHGHPDTVFAPEQWRALALGAAVAATLGERAAAHTSLAARDAAAIPALRLFALWPDDWRAPQRAAADAWLRHTVAAQGWPLERIVSAAPEADLPSPAPDALLADLARTPPNDKAPLVALVIAAASHIGEASIAHWSARATLFSPSQPQGQIPGEGAAGLLLAEAGQAGRFGDEPTLLLQGAGAVRDASADGARRADPTMLHTLATQLLGDAATLPAAVKLLVADTGHRSNRTLELMTLAGAALPALDAGEEVLRVGNACGNCGAVALVGALVLAAHQAQELQAPVLCIGNEHPLRRSAALIRPAPVA